MGGRGEVGVGGRGEVGTSYNAGPVTLVKYAT